MTSDGADNSVKALPDPKSNLAQAQAPIKILSLTGGGYRGMFTARVLVNLCTVARHTGSLEGRFAVHAGTSIGGIMACALAVGIPPHRVLDSIDGHGSDIFPALRGAKAKRAAFGSIYDSGKLEAAIKDCLGGQATRKMADVEQGLLIPAVDWSGGAVEVYRSGYFGKAHASNKTLLEVCLATSAAPTYFKPHEIDGLPMLDGGLAANNPDALALVEVLRRYPAALGRIEMLSIGTAGFKPVRPINEADKSGAAWAMHLAEFMIDVQESMAATQAQGLLGGRYLRVNHPGAPTAAFTALDNASEESRIALLRAADAAAEQAYKCSGPFIDRMLSLARAPVNPS